MGLRLGNWAAIADDIEQPTNAVMTIGALSRRTGVPVKTLREYEDPA